MKKLLKKLLPYREIILGFLIVGLFITTVLAYQVNQNQKLNPRTSSTTLNDQEGNLLPSPTKKSAKKNKREKKQEEKKEAKKTIQKETVVKKKKVVYQPKERVDSQPIAREELDEAVLIVYSGPQAGSYQLEFSPGINGLELMNVARNTYGLSYQTETYSDLGAYVSSIGGLGDNSHYWSLYHNGQYSSVGISDLLPKNNDQIGWKYLSF